MRYMFIVLTSALFVFTRARQSFYTLGSTLAAALTIPTASYERFVLQYTLDATAPSSSNSFVLISPISLSDGLSIIRTTASISDDPITRSANMQSCNNYPEFCTRRYSNITEVCSHNSAFTRVHSLFSNQAVPIWGQLDDGVRMIQGQTHHVNGTLYSCHSHCNYLNAGTLESELLRVRLWLDANPSNIVTILLANSNFISVHNYIAPMENSGIAQYAYRPSKQLMYLDDWPTLGEMIISGVRAVIFMDYMANQTVVPYILDQYSHMWETPFSPSNASFPCTHQRPEGITRTQANNRMYLANHNLNIGLKLPNMNETYLIPAISNLSSVNAVSGPGSLGAMARECVAEWARPPNFLVVDFYNRGNGSVFEVAAQMNGVKYNRLCCGTELSASEAGRIGLGPGGVSIIGAAWNIVFALAVALSVLL